MNLNTIKKNLNKKHQDFISSISNESIAKIINENTFITGGAITSYLLNEEPNDFDYYFTSWESCYLVATYYVNMMNDNSNGESATVIKHEEGNRIEIKFMSGGYKKASYKKGYQPVFITSNAITLSDGIQLILRFVGEPKEIHENYDFVHCTNFFMPVNNQLELNKEALASILTKELKYVGSKYPLASIVRTRKFIQRGWYLNAGQYLKMIMQCQDLDLKNPHVLADQLTGLDMFYFLQLIQALEEKISVDSNFKIESSFIVKLIDKIFDEEELSEYVQSDEGV